MSAHIVMVIAVGADLEIFSECLYRDLRMAIST